MPRFRMRSSVNFQSRYAAYAHNHGMTSEQMRMHDRQCYPDAMLTPFLFWLSLKRLEWNRLHPDRQIQSGIEPVEFARWLQQLEPTSNALTCECHVGTARLPGHH
jgi:hypothetical protein